jgi:hypothetical protein
MCEMAAPLGEVYGGLAIIADSKQDYQILLDIGNDGLHGLINGTLKRQQSGPYRLWRFVIKGIANQTAGYLDITESSVQSVLIDRRGDGSIMQAKIMVMT